MPGQWADSQRRSTLPKDWARVRPAILARDHQQHEPMADVRAVARRRPFATGGWVTAAKQDGDCIPAMLSEGGRLA